MAGATALPRKHCVLGLGKQGRSAFNTFRAIWRANGVSYWEGLADAFGRLESYHKDLAKQCWKAEQKRLAEQHERLAGECDRLSDWADRLSNEYEGLVKEQRR